MYSLATAASTDAEDQEHGDVHEVVDAPSTEMLPTRFRASGFRTARGVGSAAATGSAPAAAPRSGSSSAVPCFTHNCCTTSAGDDGDDEPEPDAEADHLERRCRVGAERDAGAEDDDEVDDRPGEHVRDAARQRQPLPEQPPHDDDDAALAHREDEPEHGRRS